MYMVHGGAITLTPKAVSVFLVNGDSVFKHKHKRGTYNRHTIRAAKAGNVNVKTISCHRVAQCRHEVKRARI